MGCVIQCATRASLRTIRSFRSWRIINEFRSCSIHGMGDPRSESECLEEGRLVPLFWPAPGDSFATTHGFLDSSRTIHVVRCWRKLTLAQGEKWVAQQWFRVEPGFSVKTRASRFAHGCTELGHWFAKLGEFPKDTSSDKNS